MTQLRAWLARSSAFIERHDRNGAIRALFTVVGVGIGIVLRVHAVDVPAHLTWDEPHFVENARNYLSGKADWNDHPPLGKLLIAGGMLLFGDDALGWRIVPLVLGLLMMPTAAALARAMFPRVEGVGSIAATFVALDGFLIVYSRTALLDGVLATFYLVGLLSICKYRRTWHAGVICVVIGLTASIKWTGIMLCVPFLWVLVERRLWHGLLLTPLTAVTYVLLHAVGLRISGQDSSVWAVVAKNVALLKHHLGLTDMTHPATSAWYTWLAMYNPVVLRETALPGGKLAIMSGVGHPLLWWSSSLVMLAVPFAYLRLRREHSEAAFFSDVVRPGCFGFVAWAAPIVPWIVSDRDSYIYHYLPAYATALVTLAGVVAWLRQRHPRIVLAYLGAVLALAMFFAPIWSEIPISRKGWRLRTWMGTWR